MRYRFSNGKVAARPPDVEPLHGGAGIVTLSNLSALAYGAGGITFIVKSTSFGIAISSSGTEQTVGA